MTAPGGAMAATEIGIVAIRVAAVRLWGRETIRRRARRRATAILAGHAAAFPPLIAAAVLAARKASCEDRAIRDERAGRGPSHGAVRRQPRAVATPGASPIVAPTGVLRHTGAAPRTGEWSVDVSPITGAGIMAVPISATHTAATGMIDSLPDRTTTVITGAAMRRTAGIGMAITITTTTTTTLTVEPASIITDTDIMTATAEATPLAAGAARPASIAETIGEIARRATTCRAHAERVHAM